MITKFCDVLQPTGCWDPPTEATLYLMDKGDVQVTSIFLGNWLVRDEQGRIRVHTEVGFRDNYEAVDDS